MTEGDFQKLLHIALANLRIQLTIVENEIQRTNQELRTLEQQEQLEKLEEQYLKLEKDWQHYTEFVKEGYYYEDND
ncbi:Uncharacterised protein [Listeria grayi]|nr:Uncharacterised protein [Listeria grayi]